MSVNEKMTAIANAIREKTGETGKLNLDCMATAIRGMGSGGIDKETFEAAISEKVVTMQKSTDLGSGDFVITRQLYEDGIYAVRTDYGEEYFYISFNDGGGNWTEPTISLPNFIGAETYLNLSQILGDHYIGGSIYGNYSGVNFVHKQNAEYVSKEDLDAILASL